MTDLKHQPNNVYVVNVAARQAAHQVHRRYRFPDLRVFMVALIGFCVFLTVYATQALLPLFRGLFKTDEFHVSLTVSATTIAIAIGSPVVGLLAEKWGRREVMIGSVSLLTVPVLLAATAHSLNTLIFWRFVQGLIMPGIISVTMAYVSEEWASGGAAAVMAAYVAGNVLGGVTGRFLSGLVAAHYGWPASFVVLATLNAIGAALVWRWLPPASVPTKAISLVAGLGEMSRHLRRPIMLATFVAGAGVLFALVGTFTYITFYLHEPPFNLGTAALGSLFGVYIVGVIVTPVCGRFIERLGHRRALMIAAVAAAFGDVLTLAPSLVAVVVGLAVCSSAVFVCQSAAASYLGHIAGKSRASAAGLYSTFYYAGGTAGAAIPALAWSHGGWPACVLLMVLVLGAVVMLAFTFWRPVWIHPQTTAAAAAAVVGD
jgi:MFS transporter, YNFM family, putative membrane transport protein